MDGGLKEKKAGEIKDAIKATKLRKEYLHHANTGNTTKFDVRKTPHQTTQLRHRRISYRQLGEDNTSTSRSPPNSDVRSEKEYGQHIQSGWVDESAIYTTELECGQNSMDSVEWFSSPLIGQDKLYLSVYPSSLETTDPLPTNTYSDFSSDTDLDLNLLPSISIPPTLSVNPESENTLLLIHYVDHILYVQFPFYNDALSHHGRGWLLSLITTVKPICRFVFDVMRFMFFIHWRGFANIDLMLPDYTVLALSSHHRDIKNVLGEEATRFVLYWKYYSRALTELHQHINQTGVSSGVEHKISVLFCILQLIFCEVCSGDS